MTAELRVATTEDAEPVTDLLDAIAIQLYGEPELSVEQRRCDCSLEEL